MILIERNTAGKNNPFWVYAALLGFAPQVVFSYVIRVGKSEQTVVGSPQDLHPHIENLGEIL
jgi:hypothetical protein